MKSLYLDRKLLDNPWNILKKFSFFKLSNSVFLSVKKKLSMKLFAENPSKKYFFPSYKFFYFWKETKTGVAHSLKFIVWPKCALLNNFFGTRKKNNMLKIGMKRGNCSSKWRNHSVCKKTEVVRISAANFGSCSFRDQIVLSFDFEAFLKDARDNLNFRFWSMTFMRLFTNRTD